MKICKIFATVVILLMFTTSMAIAGAVTKTTDDKKANVTKVAPLAKGDDKKDAAPVAKDAAPVAKDAAPVAKDAESMDIDDEPDAK